MSDIGPHCYKKMRVKITYNGIIYVLGVVDVSEMELLRDGGVETKYGKNSDNVLHGGDSSRRHRVGMKRMRFRLRRWFKTDTAGQRGLLFLLHNSSLSFDLEEYVPIIVSLGPEFGGIKISNCVSYSYRQVGGTANDIIVEEIVGEGTAFSEVIVTIPIEVSTDDWGYYKVFGEVWVADPTLVDGGGYYPLTGEIFFFDVIGIDAMNDPCGGAYFNR